MGPMSSVPEDSDTSEEGEEVEPVQESDEESFPASDAPSSWAGGDADSER
jgi:hypothetical protein